MTRVLVVDDQVLIRAGLAALLRAAPGIEVVGEAADGHEAVRLAAEHRPDVVLMDIRMPGLDGIEAMERILAGAGAGPGSSAGSRPGTSAREDGVADATNDAPKPPRVVILTTFDLDEYVYAALRAGAAGFLLKDTPPERLLAAISMIDAGDMLFAPTVTTRLIEAYAHRPEPSTGLPPDLAALTAREVEVLRLVGQGLSNTEIADRLVVGETTVKTHLNRTMTKLALASRAQAVALAYEIGLIVPGRGRSGS